MDRHAPKKNKPQPVWAQKTNPATDKTRDEGPRLILLDVEKKIHGLPDHRRYLELADEALGFSTKPKPRKAKA